MIDIIIPAYNAHETIKNTLLSICLQTMKEKIKVYIIDDCSDKDYSEEIKLFKQSINIEQYKTTKNSGPGIARQVGLDNSQGKYIIFMDSDDLFVDCFSVENLYKNLEETENDIAIGYVIQEDYEHNLKNELKEGSLHGKMFKRAIIDQYQLQFNDTSNHEDLAFYLLYLLATDKAIFIENNIYFYRYNPNSITQTDSCHYHFNTYGLYVKNMCWVFENAETRNFNELEIAKDVFYSLVISYCRYLENYFEDVNRILKEANNLYKYYLKYKQFLTEEIEFELYNCVELNFIPPISLRDFIYLIDKHNYND